MPRRASRVSAYHQVQERARALLEVVRRELRARERELNQLKSEESQLRLASGARGHHRTQAA